MAVETLYNFTGRGGLACRSWSLSGLCFSRSPLGISWIPPQTEAYYDYLNAADGFVPTSNDDTFPSVMLEAAALGKPVVSFASGGAKEFITEGVGTAVNSWNDEDMVEAMLKVMRWDIHVSPGLARARAKEFDISVMVKNWEELLLNHLR